MIRTLEKNEKLREEQKNMSHHQQLLGHYIIIYRNLKKHCMLVAEIK